MRATVRRTDIKRKLARGQEHLKLVARLQHRFRHSDYLFIPEDDTDPDYIAYRVRLPAIPPDFVTIAGDCIHNMRCVLDHLVWQMADVAKPNRTDQARKRNMFPLCWSRGEFREQVRRDRLNGVPAKARTLIRRLQPYNPGCELLGVLGELENIDKHRSIMVATSVAVGGYAAHLRERFGFHLPLWGEVMHDGAIGFRVRRGAVTASLGPDFGKVNVKAHGTLHILFGDPPAQGLSVDSTLQQVAQILEDAIIPAFDPFL